MPTLKLDDTIAAVSTPPGEGGIAVIRVSGKRAIRLVQRFFRPSKQKDLTEQSSHTIHHGHWMDGRLTPLDEVCVGLFRAPHSYTGEEVVEISCHGGIRLTRRILELLVQHGARHAEPGEFTKRAFLNGRLDLTQAEAVLDLIRARSDVSLETASRQLQGSLSKKIHSLKETLLKICAHLEASLDFPDEHLEADPNEEISKRLKEVQEEIQGLVASFKRGAMLREGILTVIVGRPNVGKSSLLNVLLGRDRALVSPIPGTTRDTLEETIEIRGFAIRLVDTAGLTLVPKDEVEQMGIERTQTSLKEGNLFLFLVDGSSEWTPEDATVLSKLRGRPFLPIVNKIDLPHKLDLKAFEEVLQGEKPCFVSCLTGQWLLELEKQIGEKLIQLGMAQESLTVTRLRHRQALEQALKALEYSQKGIEKGISPELILIDLKSAMDSLKELIGEIYSEDLLDVLFQEFCIGK